MDRLALQTKQLLIRYFQLGFLLYNLKDSYSDWLCSVATSSYVHVSLKCFWDKFSAIFDTKMYVIMISLPSSISILSHSPYDYFSYMSFSCWNSWFSYKSCLSAATFNSCVSQGLLEKSRLKYCFKGENILILFHTRVHRNSMYKKSYKKLTLFFPQIWFLFRY